MDAIDFAHVDIVLTRAHDGAPKEVARGSANAILDGDPFGTVVMLANAPPDAARGLRAGDIVTTGSCTGAPPLPGDGAYRAGFASLGSVEFVFAA
jgi:2-keto-4-pentenoate hydratase